MTWKRLGCFSMAVLISPLLVLEQAIAGGDDTTAQVRIVVVGLVVVLLVLTRSAGWFVLGSGLKRLTEF